ncbi:hypothetical protein [Veillonella sp. 3891]|uniref:hypothetical protein n=2 Tax=unclassified Veillonella TaxID=2630086 RepID=UPI000F8F05E1|nr:hypothetical protein [Veillonella sp. 3891]
MQENLKSEYNAYVRAIFLTVIIEGIYISLTGVPKGLNAWVTVVFIGFILFVGFYRGICDYSILKENETALEQLKKELVNLFETEQYSFSEFDLYNEDRLNQILGDSILGKDWEATIRNEKYLLQYSKTGIEGSSRLYFTVDIREIFDVDSAYDSIKFNDLRNNMPAIMTGLGILGTFVGLTLGLYTLNLNSTGADGLQTQINNLISSSGTAFITSLFGILFSLAYSWKLSSFKDTFFTYYAEVINYLYSKLPYLSESQLLIDSVNTLHGQTNSINDSLELYATTLGASLSSNIGDVIEEKLIPKYDTLNENLLGLNQKMEDLSTNFSEFHKITSNSVGEALVSGVGSEIETLGHTLQQFSEGLIAHENERKATLEGLQSSMDTMMKNTEGVSNSIFESMKQQYEHTSQIMENKIQLSIDEYEKIGQSQREELDHFITIMINAISKNATELQTTAKQMTEDIHKVTHEGITDIIEGLNSVLSDSLHISKGFIAQQKESTESIKGLSGIVESVMKDSEVILDGMNDAMKETKNVLTEVKDSSGLITRNIQGLTTLNGNLITYEEKMKTSIQAMEATLMNYQQSLQSTLTPLLEGLERVTSETTVGAEEMRSTINELEELWQEHEQTYSNFTAQLQDVFTLMNENINGTYNELHTNLNTTLRDFDLAMGKGVEGLKTSIADLSESKETLKEYLDKRLKH